MPAINVVVKCDVTLAVCRLLKLAAGFYPRHSTSCDDGRPSTSCDGARPPSTSCDGARRTTELGKQCVYVRCIVQLVCRCAVERAELNVNSLSLVINNLMSDVDAVAAASE